GHDLAGHRNLGERVGVGGHGLAIDEQHRGERHRRAGLTRELLHLDDVADSDAVLLAAGLDDRVHETTPDVALWDLGSPPGHSETTRAGHAKDQGTRATGRRPNRPYGSPGHGRDRRTGRPGRGPAAPPAG